MAALTCHGRQLSLGGGAESARVPLHGHAVDQRQVHSLRHGDQLHARRVVSRVKPPPKRLFRAAGGHRDVVVMVMDVTRSKQYGVYLP